MFEFILEALRELREASYQAAPNVNLSLLCRHSMQGALTSLYQRSMAQLQTASYGSSARDDEIHAPYQSKQSTRWM